MSIRVLHLSDLHIGARGTRQDATFGLALAGLIDTFDPALVLTTGDLTHRGSARQHADAAAFLRSLPRPLLVVPGNHDMPYAPIARLGHPWRTFERYHGTTEPVFTGEGLLALGLNSARPLRQQGGSLSRGQLARASERLAAGGADVFKLVALHHHLIGAPWRSRKRPLRRRSLVLERLHEAGAEMIVAGHIHQVTVGEAREFSVRSGGPLLTTAPGLGRPRPRRRGEACGVLAYTIEPETIEVGTFVWQEQTLVPTALRLFARGGAILPAGEPSALAQPERG